ncbi:MAG: cache domain-containing protein [Proteobacteria bacterium]|nr:cache domain-containing protein [Pseudomonadota bacterium]
MKKIAAGVFLVILSFTTAVQAEEKITTQELYSLVLKAHDVIKNLGEEGFQAFNTPKSEFILKDTYVYVMKCPDTMAAHPYAMDKLRGTDISTIPITPLVCEAAVKPNGAWIEYKWPKPDETTPSRKIAFCINVEGTPYQVIASVFTDTEKIEPLNKMLGQ